MAKEMMKRDEAVAVLSTTEHVDVLEFALGKDVKFDLEGGNITLQVAGGKYDLEDEAYIKACRIVGIPESYVRKCPVALLNPHLNFWFQERLGGAMQSVVKDSKVIALVKDSVEVISNLRLLSMVEEAVVAAGGEQSVLGYDKVFNDVHQTQFSVVSSRLAGEPKRGDVLWGGVQVQNSLLGEKPIEVGAYVYRLVCANGMISAQQIFKWRRRNLSEDLMGWVASAARQSADAVVHEMEHITRLVELRIEGHVSAVLTSLFEEYGVPVSLRAEIMERVLQEGAESFYDIWNAVTYVASNSPALSEKPESVRRLQMVAGDMLVDKSICPTCFAVTKG